MRQLKPAVQQRIIHPGMLSIMKEKKKPGEIVNPTVEELVNEEVKGINETNKKRC
jgi:hypothetical protein